MRAQVALESLVVLAGLFAFVAVLVQATGPLREASLGQADRLGQEGAFERLRVAVLSAEYSGNGFLKTDSFRLTSNASVAWNRTDLIWQGPHFMRTLHADFSGSGSASLPVGKHSFSVKKKEAVELDWAVNSS